MGFDQFHGFMNQESVVDEELVTVGLHTQKRITRTSEILRETHVPEANMSLFTGTPKRTTARPARSQHNQRRWKSPCDGRLYHGGMQPALSGGFNFSQGSLSKRLPPKLCLSWKIGNKPPLGGIFPSSHPRSAPKSLHTQVHLAIMMRTSSATT